MSKWKYRLNVKHEWQATKAGDMALPAFAAFVAGRLEKMSVFETDWQLQDIGANLRSFSEGQDAITEDFDEIWDSLYDWADQSLGMAKKCAGLLRFNPRQPKPARAV